MSFVLVHLASKIEFFLKLMSSFLKIFEKLFFFHPFLFFSLLKKEQNKKISQFFCLEWTKSTQSNGGRRIFLTLSPLSSSFYFTPPFSLFFLPPLSLFTHFLHLHFLLHHNISSIENHFPKLLSLLSFISLNIFSELCVLDHLCYKPII